MIYARSLDQDNVPLSRRLGTVQPRGNGNGAAIAGTSY
jgi:hypothetical protein